MLHGGREVKYWEEYLLGADHHIFHNVSVQDPLHNTNHYMVLGCLYVAAAT